MTGRALPGPGRELAALPPGTPVTVRHRVPDLPGDPDSIGFAVGRPLLADVVATVAAVGADRVELVRGDGTAVSVRLDRVTAVRVLPGPPGAGRPTDPLGLARIAAAGWPAAETVWLGNWLLRAAGGWTRRANSALILGAPDRPLRAALAAIGDWYGARGLPPVLSVAQPPAALGVDGVLDSAALEAAGWRSEAPTAVLVARSADVLAALEPAAEPWPAVRLSPTPGSAWLADYRDAATHPAATAVLAGPAAPARVCFAEVPPTAGRAARGHGGNPGRVAGLAARGRAVTLDGWVGLAAVGVAPEYRRTGVGRLLVSALLADGLRHGGVRSYVEVESGNAGALAFWDRLGYRRSHDSIYYRLVI